MNKMECAFVIITIIIAKSQNTADKTKYTIIIFKNANAQKVKYGCLDIVNITIIVGRINTGLENNVCVIQDIIKLRENVVK